MNKYCGIVLTVVLAASVTHAAMNFDNIDPNVWFGESGFLKEALGCQLDLLPCDPVNKFFKEHVTEVFQTAGSNMNAKQKHVLAVFYELGTKRYPHLILAFNAKNDPTGELTPKLLANLKDSD